MKTEKIFAKVFQESPVGMALLDSHLRFVRVNGAFCQMLGFTEQELLGLTSLDVTHPDDRETSAEHAKKVFADEIPLYRIENRYITKDKQVLQASLTASPVRDERGKPLYGVAIVEDITERKQAEGQLAQAEKMASLRTLAGAIAHEVRNPLGVILVSDQLMLDHPDDRKLFHECADKISSATQRASHIIDNLLKFASPLSEQREEVDVHAALEETLALLTHMMTLKKVKLRTKPLGNCPRVHGNAEMLQQVFTNLILNACNSMPHGGTLTMACGATESGEAKVEFTDTGHGIPPQDLTRIFDPFFTTMPDGKGAGLGLSISYSIIQQHKGRIEVASEVNKGTTFTLFLPGIDR